MVEILHSEANLVALKLSGKLHDADYKQFMPVIQAAAEKGKLHLLVEMMIGDKQWQAWMTKICKPFTRAQIQYFDASDAQNAWAWVQDGL